MTLSSPPPGGGMWISESTPAGGQITPLESASLSLRLGEGAPPTVGGGVRTSGGQAASGCGVDGCGVGLSALDCAAATPVQPTLTSSAMTTAWRKSVLPDLDWMN